MTKALYMNNTDNMYNHGSWLAMEADRFPHWKMMEKYARLVNPGDVAQAINKNPEADTKRAGIITHQIPLTEILDFDLVTYMELENRPTDIIALGNVSIRSIERRVRKSIAAFFMAVALREAARV